MRTAVDTNILSAIWSGEMNAAEITRALFSAKSDGKLLISAVVYAEAIAQSSISEWTAKRFFRRHRWCDWIL